MQYRSIAALAICAVVAFWAGWQLAPSTEGNDKPLSSNNRAFEEKVETLQRTANEMQREKELLRGLVKAADATTVTSEESEQASDNDLDGNPDNAEQDARPGPQVVRETADRFVEDTNRRLETDPSYDVNSVISESYEAEPIDDTWARETEEVLQELFAVQETLQGAVLQSMECRSERCRLALYYQDKAEINDISSTLTQHFSRVHQGLFAPGVMVNYAPDGETAYLYLGTEMEGLYGY